MNTHQASKGNYLSAYEVARILCVAPETVTRWARVGKISFIWTPGGQRRYLRSEVELFLRVQPRTVQPRTVQPRGSE